MSDSVRPVTIEREGTTPAAALAGAASPSDGDVFKKRIRDAADALRLYERMVWSRKAYAPSNRNRRSMEARAVERMKAFLAEYGEFDITITETAIEFDDQMIEKIADDKQHYAGRLFRDGVRRVVFLPDATTDELLAFADVLNDQSRYSGGQNDDLAAVLWRHDFKSIEYEALEDIELTEFAGAGTIHEDIAALVRELRERAPIEANDERVSAMLDEPLDDETRKRAIANANDVLANPLRYQLTEEENIRLFRDVQRILQNDFTAKYIGLALSLYTIGGPRRVEQLEQILRIVLESVFRNRQFRQLADFVEALRDHRVNLDADAQAVIDRLLEQIASEDHLRQMAELLSSDHLAIEPDAIVRLFDAMGADALPPLVQLYMMIPVPQRRAELKPVLLHYGSERLDALKPILLGEDLVIAAEAVKLLEELHDPRARELIFELLEHPDADRRKLTVYAMTRPELCGPAELRKVLNDADSEVRVLGLRLVIRMRDRHAFPLLKRRIEGKDNVTCEPYERGWMFAALAIAGGNHAVEVLKPLTEKGTLLRRTAAEERLAALGAVALTRSPDGEAVLRKAALDDDDKIRDFAVKLLENPTLFAQQLQRQPAPERKTP